jgi:hypothetical protein
MATVYHVTERHNVPTILRDGLIPKIGPRSKRAKEKTPRIYVFPDMTSMEDGVCNWLGDEFTKRTSLLEINVPDEWLTHDAVRWEATICQPVPPSCIKVIVDDMDA